MSFENLLKMANQFRLNGNDAMADMVMELIKDKHDALVEIRKQQRILKDRKETNDYILKRYNLIKGA